MDFINPPLVRGFQEKGKYISPAFHLTAGSEMYHGGFVLNHRVRRVSPILEPYVEHLWMARGYLPVRWRNMILPDGAVELIVNLGDPQNLCARNNLSRHTAFRHSWISGERTSPIVIDEIGYVHLVGVRLRAGGAWPFLGIPLREFTDQVLELETIYGREIEHLRDQLGDVLDDDSRFDLLESWLVRRLRARTPPTRSVSYTLRAIEGGLETVRIGRIADTIGISHKHLLREFDRCVGLTPKLFARLCSFQRVIRSVGQKAEVDWAGTAARCGYHDQAHLIHEFRAFSGLTPADYLNVGHFSITSKSNSSSSRVNKCQFSTILTRQSLAGCDQ